ncbi:MAG: DinB family protein [Acidimicrobiia bacterium]|nr:DinB family protein [Acidimicrobiia bacterium]MDH4363483.1 DinB family protein [Acidimicrobiia bacterium]
MTVLSLHDLLHEYDLARAWTDQLTADLDDDTLYWRPSPASSAIAWHLGHQAAVNHFLIRNLLSAEPSPDPGLDAVFDSATPEADRGDLPGRARLSAYRAAVAERTRAMAGRIDRGAVGAPSQMPMIAAGVLVAAINHEYQHDAWVDEMRQLQGLGPGPVPGSGRVTMIDGYWVVQP